MKSLPLSIKNKRRYYLIIIGFCFAFNFLQAQQPFLKVDVPSFKPNVKFFGFKMFVNQSNTFSQFNAISSSSPVHNILRINSGSINDMPFFCAMECKVRNHTNIWIKLRAGNDESYMRMIHSGVK